MTSHSARTMREVTETVVIHAFLYFWNKFLVQILGKGHFKSGKSSVLQARNRSFVRRGFRRKVPICLSSTKLSEVVQTLPLTLLHQTAAYKYFQIFLKSCLKSCECIHIYIYIYIRVCMYVYIHSWCHTYWTAQIFYNTCHTHLRETWLVTATWPCSIAPATSSTRSPLT
jgi:hypothetical protein